MTKERIAKLRESMKQWERMPIAVSEEILDALESAMKREAELETRISNLSEKWVTKREE